MLPKPFSNSSVALVGGVLQMSNEVIEFLFEQEILILIFAEGHFSSKEE